jgi:hypothetical protein
VAALPAAAQGPAANSFFQRQSFLDEATRKKLDADVPVEQKVLLEYGGYFIPQWQQYDDVRRQSNYRQLDLRLWGQLVFDDVHRVYARLQMTHTNFAPGDSPFSWNQDLEGPNLDQGFYELRLSRALQKYWGVDPQGTDIRLTLGRQFVEFGNGLALSQTLDGGTIDIETGRWKLRGLLANTNRHSLNIDHSTVVDGHQDRLFVGFQVDYLGLSGHQPFFYFFSQEDHTDEEPVSMIQEFQYDTRYLGFGSTGEIVQNLRYSTEAVFEFGHGYDTGAGPRNDVRAFAFDQLVEYFLMPESKHQPVLSAEYAVATGDRDRQVATDTLGGNAANNDNAFLGFGYFNTGYAFAPTFTNLHIVRLGARAKPLPGVDCFKDLEVGVDFFSFMKQKINGPISDFRANVNSRELGNEVDIYANWKICSDLSAMVRYGRFWTGEAYADGEKRDYIYAGLIYSF